MLALMDVLVDVKAVVLLIPAKVVVTLLRVLVVAMEDVKVNALVAVLLVVIVGVRDIVSF